MAQPPLSPPVVGFPASQAWLTAQLYNPLVYILARMPITVVKPGNTNRANATLADDPDLHLTLPAAGTYWVQAGLRYAAIAAAGFQTAWDVSAAVTSANRYVQGPGSAASDPNADNMAMRSGGHNYATSVAYGNRGSASQYAFAYEQSMVTTSGPATIAVQWAQNTTNGTASVLALGSWLTSTRVDQ